MVNYFKILVSNSSKASSRRFIAILTLPLYLIGIGIGFILGVTINDFRFFLTAMIAAALPIFLAFYALTWEHVKGILNAKIFEKKSNGLYEMTDDQLKDP